MVHKSATRFNFPFQIPHDIESSEGALKVIFKTDKEGSGKGFIMTYVAVEQAYINSEEIIS